MNNERMKKLGKVVDDNLEQIDSVINCCKKTGKKTIKKGSSCRDIFETSGKKINSALKEMLDSMKKEIEEMV